jgi:hypothetical protein
MIQVVYVSRARDGLSSADLLDILMISRRNNPANGITGMLLFGNGNFLQVLEGEESTVDALLDKLARDPRHAQIQVLSRRAIDHRQYSNWGMGFERLSPQALDERKSLAGFSLRDFDAGYLASHDDTVEQLLEPHRAPHWDPLLRELDARDRLIAELQQQLADTRGRLQLANLVLESVVEAKRGERFDGRHLALCESALGSLR